MQEENTAAYITVLGDNGKSQSHVLQYKNMGMFPIQKQENDFHKTDAAFHFAPCLSEGVA